MPRPCSRSSPTECAIRWAAWAASLEAIVSVSVPASVPASASAGRVFAAWAVTFGEFEEFEEFEAWVVRTARAARAARAVRAVQTGPLGQKRPSLQACPWPKAPRTQLAPRIR